MKPQIKMDQKKIANINNFDNPDNNCPETPRLNKINKQTLKIKPKMINSAEQPKIVLAVCTKRDFNLKVFKIRKI